MKHVERKRNDAKETLMQDDNHVKMNIGKYSRTFRKEFLRKDIVKSHFRMKFAPGETISARRKSEKNFWRKFLRKYIENVEFERNNTKKINAKEIIIGGVLKNI